MSSATTKAYLVPSESQKCKGYVATLETIRGLNGAGLVLIAHTACVYRRAAMARMMMLSCVPLTLNEVMSEDELAGGPIGYTILSKPLAVADIKSLLEKGGRLDMATQVRNA